MTHSTIRLDESDPPVDDLRELGRVSVEFEGDDD